MQLVFSLESNGSKVHFNEKAKKATNNCANCANCAYFIYGVGLAAPSDSAGLPLHSHESESDL